MLASVRDWVSRRQPELRLALRMAVEEMRAAGATRHLSADAVARVFGVVFILEQLRINLEDFVSRSTESARAD